uniref:Uncharacterized protein n=1 Tax=Avena sativa TaxID=4498 RepID=A0ACD6A0W5_AVESA
MVGGHGGSLRRTPARASEDSDAPSSRHPLLGIRTPVSQFKRKIEWPVETPSKPPPLSRFRRPLPRGEETPSRVVSATPCSAQRVHRAKTAGGGSVQRKPVKSTTKPACIVRTSGTGARRLGLGSGFSVPARGLQATVVNSQEVPHYDLQEDPSFWMENNVQVVIRVRPLNSTEKSSHGYNRCLKQESAQSITWIGHPEARFTFDHVACESVNQEELFRVIGLPMVENCMAGYNSCVFSYGQTGSGKTHTMFGEISELGVKSGPECGMIPRIFELLVARIREEEESRRGENLKYNCKCSFLEIYNEQITDLLGPSSTNLHIRKDTIVGTYVENLTKREVTCVGDIITLLKQSFVNRKMSATNMNSASSRSHTVFTCTIESRWEKDSICNSQVARLNLVDLAGSERQTTSGAEGDRLKEASNINKSLLMLRLVITSLVDRTCGKNTHVPYRDSKLTFLLQDSLGGNSKTLIIVNVSPSLGSSNETLSTLKFAQPARLIQNNAIVNEDSLGDVQALQHQICVLKEELAVIKGQLALQTQRALGAEEQCNADVVSHLRKERDSADNELQMIRSQFDKLLLEKENAIECHLKSQGTIKDLNSEVLQLKSEIIDKEKCYEARLKELELKMQEKDDGAAASLILWHTEKETLQFEVSEAKGLAEQKSSEASTLTAKFQDAQATIANAESTMVKALMEANENSKLQAEKYKQKESLFIIEKDDLLSELSSLKMLLGANELNYQDMEKKFESSLIEANEVASELEDGIRHLKNFLSENLESVSSDVEWMKSKFRQFTELARTWLEDIWLEIIGKDCTVSVLHLCHMGILLERITGLHAEKSFLQRGICESNSLIYTLQAHNDKTEKQLANAARKLGAVSMENSELRSQLKHLEQISYSMKEELARKSNDTETMEEELAELRNLFDERSSFLQNLQHDFSKLSDEKQCCDSQVLILRDKLERAQAVADESEAISTEARQIADEMKKYAEEKNEEIKLLERSNDDLESTVCVLEERLESKVCELNAVSVAKNEQEGTELLSSRLCSFGKNIMHLQRQEEAMLARSTSMHSELSVLIEEIDATNRSALVAKSKENQELRCQLDEALLLNGMFKDKRLEDLSLLQVNNNAIPVNDMEGLCSLLANCHHEPVMISTMAKDIETIVLASELKQHKAEVQEHTLMCTEVLEGLKTKAILWKADQELGSVIIDDLLEENSNTRADLEKLKRNKDEIMVRVKRMYAATSLMCSLPK